MAKPTPSLTASPLPSHRSQHRVFSLHVTVQPRQRHLFILNIQPSLGSIMHDTKISSRKDAANCLQRILRRRVMVSSARQAISGLLAVGGVYATRYLAKKVSKAWKSWR